MLHCCIVPKLGCERLLHYELSQLWLGNDEFIVPSPIKNCDHMASFSHCYICTFFTCFFILILIIFRWMMNERRLMMKHSCRYWKNSLTKLLSYTEINALKNCARHLAQCKLAFLLSTKLIIKSWYYIKHPFIGLQQNMTPQSHSHIHLQIIQSNQNIGICVRRGSSNKWMNKETHEWAGFVK